MQKQDKVTALPGVLATLATGFDLTAKHLWLLILPILLDIFLWLGPRLSFQNLLLDMLENLRQVMEMQGLEQGVGIQGMDIAEFSAPLAEIASQTNLFTMLSMQMIGVPAFMAGLTTETTPVTAVVQQIPNWFAWLGLFILLMVGGVLLTAVYYTLVATVITQQNGAIDVQTQRGLGWRIVHNWLRLIGLVIIFFVSAFILYIPLLIIGTLLFLVSPGLGTTTAMAGPFLAIWIAIFMCYAPFGIVYQQRPLLKAIQESFQLVRTFLVPTMFFLMTIFLIATLLDWVLIFAENGTWFTAINILAHAFVSTAIVAAMFIFYRDRYAILFSETINA